MRSYPSVNPDAPQFDEYPNSITFVEHVVDDNPRKPIDWVVVLVYASLIFTGTALLSAIAFGLVYLWSR